MIFPKVRPERNTYYEENPMKFGVNNMFIEEVDFMTDAVK
jgi:hypothetical protein